MAHHKKVLLIMVMTLLCAPFQIKTGGPNASETQQSLQYKNEDSAPEEEIELDQMQTYKRKNLLPQLTVKIPPKKPQAPPILLTTFSTHATPPKKDKITDIKKSKIKKTPQISSEELLAIINPNLWQWICGGGRHVRKTTMELAEHYNPETELFGSGNQITNNMLLCEAFTSFTRHKQKDELRKLFNLCHEKKIGILARTIETIVTYQSNQAPPSQTFWNLLYTPESPS